MALADDLSLQHTTAVRCEVFPLVWLDGQPAYLRHSSAGGRYPAWWLAPPPRTDPSLIVRQAVSDALAGWYDPVTSVVHSTSWRFEPLHSALVLSYLAIVTRAGRLLTGFDAQPLAALDALPGTARSTAIEPTDVLVHGLRHFALLRVTDPMVAAALPDEWHDYLSHSRPLPAGLLTHYADIPV